MKALVAKKDGRVVAIGVPNSEIAGSSSIAQGEGIEISEVEIPDTEFGDSAALRKRFEALGAVLGPDRR